MTPAEWFSRRRLGLFVHFGLYAIEGWHEQDRMRRRIPRDVYEALIHRFDPVDFSGEALVALAESTGMEYVCLTAKHHDGFCLWDTAQSDFSAMNAPCRRDLVGELAQACHRRGMPLGLYYSVVDWHHPNYPNRGRHHELPGPDEGDRPDWPGYLDYLKEQVRELCTRYGPVRHFFWDMNVPGFRDRSINDMIRRLQPGIVINNRGFDEGDFGTPEREFQQDETERVVRFQRPTEACNAVGTQSWGYRAEESYYSAAFLIRGIDAMMARGAHYLLNVGPDSRGKVPEQAVRLLDQIGSWYARTREAFGDAEPASELATHREVLLTRRDNTLYVHVPSPARTDSIMLPPISAEPVRAVLLNTGDALGWTTEVQPVYWQSGARVLTVTGLPPDALAGGETLVVRLDFDSPPSTETQSTVKAFDG